MSLVSFIVPVYNAEKSVGFTISSILNQTFRDIELILVNDGSKDNSLAICKNYEYLDNRVKVLDIPNQGVSEARNAGIEYATGTYIQFVDSDDVIVPQRTERMLAATQLYGIDLVICSYYQILICENDIVKEKLGLLDEHSELVFDKLNLMNKLTRLIWETSLIEPPWNKLFLRSLIMQHNIRFPKEYSLGEDFIFNLDYIAVCNGAVFLSDALCYYMVDTECSLTSRKRHDMLKNMLDVEKHLETVINNGRTPKKEELRYLYSHCVCKVISSLEHVCNCDLDDVMAQNQLYFDIACAVNDPFVRKSFKKANFYPDKFLPLRVMVESNDVKKIVYYMQQSLLPYVPPTNPSFLNKMSVSLCLLLQKLFKKGKINKWAHILELNLKTVGFKATFKRVINKANKKSSR